MRRLIAIALLCLIFGAGCMGTPGGSTATPQTNTPVIQTSTTETPTPATPSETITPDGSSPTHETPTAVSTENTVAFENLTERQQAAFLDALDGTIRFVPNSSYIDENEGYANDIASPFRTHSFVRYEGQYYRPSFDSGARLYATYEISASPGTPSPNASVIGFQDLPANVSDVVRRAIVNGTYTAPAGKWSSLRDPLPIRYIQFDDETYVMSYAVGDIWAKTMTVEESS